MISVIVAKITIIIVVPPNTVPRSIETNSNQITEQVYFYHYSRHMPNNPIELKIGERLDSTINSKLPWKFFIHGWNTSPAFSPWFHTGKAAYFQKGDYNVMFVDWSKASNQAYINAIINIIGAGSFLGKFIVHLNQNGVSYDDIHLLSHSLGSHMAGFTGKYVTDNAGKIGRITGLDPAGPFFEANPLLTASSMQLQEPRLFEAARTLNPQMFQNQDFLVREGMRLSINDAVFVDVIHTDGYHFGMRKPIGHCDFYPNGGEGLQPGCETTTDVNCSHVKSVEYFVESITSNNFVATQCPSYQEYIDGKCKNNTKAVMGEHTNSKTRGIFYLHTNAEPPFGRGDL